MVIERFASAAPVCRSCLQQSCAALMHSSLYNHLILVLPFSTLRVCSGCKRLRGRCSRWGAKRAIAVHYHRPRGLIALPQCTLHLSSVTFLFSPRLPGLLISSLYSTYPPFLFLSLSPDGRRARSPCRQHECVRGQQHDEQHPARAPRGDCTLHRALAGRPTGVV